MEEPPRCHFAPMRVAADKGHVPFVYYISLLINIFPSKTLQGEGLIGTVTKCVLLPFSFNKAAKSTKKFRVAESHIIKNMAL